MVLPHLHKLSKSCCGFDSRSTKAAMSNIYLMFLPEGTDKVCLKICLDGYFYVYVSLCAMCAGMSLKVRKHYIRVVGSC